MGALAVAAIVLALGVSFSLGMVVGHFGQWLAAGRATTHIIGRRCGLTEAECAALWRSVRRGG